MEDIRAGCGRFRNERKSIQACAYNGCIARSNFNSVPPVSSHEIEFSQ